MAVRRIGGAAIVLVCLALLCVAGGAADASTPGPACPGVNQTLSPVRRQTYAALVANSLRTKVDPAAIHVTRFMESGPWSLVWARPPNAEQGVFFFVQSAGVTHFKDVWGGYASPADRADVVHWAHERGASLPDALAACFADAVTGG